jgi:flagellar hook-basal body complex protein FliE
MRHATLTTIAFTPCWDARGRIALDVPRWRSRMNVTLKPFDFAQAVARAGLNINGQPLGSAAPVQGAGFQQALTQALGKVSDSQHEASRLQREVQMDNPTVSLEETMVAMQKAQIGFQATLAVRNRLVSAYSDIMNMQV